MQWRFIPTVSLFLLVPFAAFSQGLIRGSVSDSTTGDRLIGVNVFLVGTSLGSATDIEGDFRIPSVPSGSYVLRASYLGFEAKQTEVTVTDDAEIISNFHLLPSVIEGEEVVITGQAKGQVAAINQQINSATIINVISEERIKELPDANAAEAIGRLPGVSVLRAGGEASKVVLRGLSDRYSSVTIDGVRIPPTEAETRGVDLSMISQTSLAGVELHKALTSDMDADAIAGSVNLVTRKAPAEGLMRVDLKGNYNHLMSAYDQYDVSMRYGSRFFDESVGIQVAGNLERRNRSNERSNINYTLPSDTSYYISNFLLEFTDEIRSRSGAGLFLDVNTPDGGTFRFNNMYSRTDRDYLFSTRDYPVNDDVYYTFRDREQIISTLNSSMRGENFVGPLSLSWGISYGQSLSDFPYDYYVDFRESSNSDVDGNPISGMAYTPLIQDRPERIIPAALNNYASAILYQAYYRSEDSGDRERTGYVNMELSYTVLDELSGSLRVGGKYRGKSRHRNRGEMYSPYYLGYWQDHYVAEDGSLQVKDLRGTRFESFYERFLQSSTSRFVTAAEFVDNPVVDRNLFGLYRITPLINRDALRQWYDLNKTGRDVSGVDEYHDNPAIDADYYGVTERVTGAYAMHTATFGTFATFIAGLRLEREQNDYASRWSPVSIGGFPVPQGITDDTTASYSETVTLPNFHLTLKPAGFVNIRLAAYRAIARPDFNLRLEKFIAWTGFSNAKRLILGNPKLKTAKAWNYEINTSLFGDDFGLVSVSAFYKRITDMYHVLSNASTTGNNLLDKFGIGWRTIHSGDYSLTVPYNSPKPTDVWGLEFEHQMNFSRFPGFLKGIVLSYNFSFTRSKTYLYSTTIDTTYYYLPEFPGIPFPLYESVVLENSQKLEGQPEFFGNISLGYDDGGFSGRVSLFHQAEYNQSFSARGLGDQVITRFTRLDVSLKQEILPGVAAILSVNNITDIEEGNIIVNRVAGFRVPNTAERYGVTADFGIRVEL